MSGDYIIGWSVASALAWGVVVLVLLVMAGDRRHGIESPPALALFLAAGVLVGAGAGAAAVSGAVVAGLERGR